MRYRPHNYQQTATRFILDHPEAAILLGMGLGKSVITLTAIWELLLDYFTVSRVLVVAPLRGRPRHLADRSRQVGPPRRAHRRRRCRNQARPAGGVSQVGDGDRHQPGKHPLARRPVRR